MKPNWDEAPDGATHYSVCSEAASPWIRRDSFGDFWALSDGKWVEYTDHEVCNLHFKDAIPAPTEWLGPEDGLPPVGVICEVRKSADYPKHWTKCEIIHHFDAKEVRVAAAIVHEGDSRNVIQGIARCFRPIRTDRDKALAEMWDIANEHSDYGVGAMMGALYDAGWRKRMSRTEAYRVLHRFYCVKDFTIEPALDALGFKE